jgi:hypothetical protein
MHCTPHDEMSPLSRVLRLSEGKEVLLSSHSEAEQLTMLELLALCGVSQGFEVLAKIPIVVGDTMDGIYGGPPGSSAVIRGGRNRFDPHGLLC